MMRFHPAATYVPLPLMLMVCAFSHAAQHVNYESFGAVGDGKADDLPAIVRAHAHANEHGLPVRTNPDATYHLGRQALTAIIQTDTDWNTSKFIIDDSQGVDDFTRPLFEITSRLDPVPLKIDRLTRGQARLNVRPPVDCFVYVENKNRRLFIRRGGNQNSGTTQQEPFILRRDGTIEGGIDWDYETVTRVIAQPIDPEPLIVRGGLFTSIGNRDTSTKYWGRNISIRRSNTGIDGVTLKVTGEIDVGSPYRGFLSASRCAYVTFRNCQIDGRKTFYKIGNAGTRVPMGTYGYSANGVMHFRMIGCKMDDIHDRTRWGIIGTNFMKNILLEDCELSRMDVHQGVSGEVIVRRTTLGHAGFNMIGRGRLIVEDSTLHGGSLINFRSDYGSTWEGDVFIRNCRWVTRSRNAVMFNVNNDGTHNFGYPCFMPRLIRIEGLVVEDSKHGKNHSGIQLFGNPLPGAQKDRPFPVRLTERIEVKGLETTSGKSPRVSNNPEVEKAIKVRLDSKGS
jgi:hypothetical protein